ncbi:MAG TPA: fibronectin type III domain-containing protein, partial [Elusimicrobiota bacterium]|nr:fibronectin type III domain-containing protein [Elusimicrobiota bacterium]
MRIKSALISRWIFAGLLMAAPAVVAQAIQPQMLWVADGGAGKVWPIIIATTAPTLGTPFAGFTTPGPSKFVAAPDNNTGWIVDSMGGRIVSIVNLASAPVVGPSVSGMTAPMDMAITPDGTMAWVIESSSRARAVTLGGTPALGAAINGLFHPRSIAISPDGNTAWVTDPGAGKVWPIVNLRTSPALGTAITGIASPTAIVISANGSTAWVGDATGKVWPINNLSATPSLGTAVTSLGFGSPSAIVLSLDGNTAWVADSLNGKVWPIMNLNTSPAMGAAIGGMTSPDGIVLTADGTTAWVSDQAGRVWPIRNLTTAPTLGAAVSGMTAPYSVAIASINAGGGGSGGSGNPPPNNATITSWSMNQITASWLPMNGTNGFTVQASTVPDFSGVLVTSGTADPNATMLTLNGPTPDTTYFVEVGAIYPSTVSFTITSPPAVVTLAALVTGVSVIPVSSTTIQVNWTPVSGAQANGYVVQASLYSNMASPSFAQLVTPGVNGWLIAGLQPGTSYYVDVGSLDWTSNVNHHVPAFGPFMTLASSGGSGGGGGSSGSATVTPPTVTEGSNITAMVTYAAPSGGLAPGAQIEVDIPPGWYPNPQTTDSTLPNYVTVTSTTGAVFNVVINSASNNPVATVQSGLVPAGGMVSFTFQNIGVACPQPNQPQALWTVRAMPVSGGAVLTLNPSPVENYGIGPARILSYNPWLPITVTANAPSQPIVLQLNDSCEKPVTATTAIAVNLAGQIQSSGVNPTNPDPGAQFSLSGTNFGGALANSLVIPVFGSGATYYYQTSSVGTNLAISASYVSPYDSTNQMILLNVTSLGQAPTFSNMDVDTGLPVAGQKTVTLLPSGTASGGSVFIRFAPSNTSLQWHVAISNDGFQTSVFDRWGFGDPQGTLNWDGRDWSTPSGPFVPNGDYTVKVEYPGLTADTSMSIVVNSSQISGTVTLGGSPVAGVQMSAQGANGPGYSQSVTDANGNYVLGGLNAGQIYNLFATYTSGVTQAVVTGQLNNIAAPSTGKNIALSAPAILRIAATAPTPAGQTIYGNLNVHTTDYSQNYFGNLRFLAGSTTSDNGDSFNPSTWTILYVQPGQYVIHPTIQGYGASDITVTASADVVITLTARASIYGLVSLPSPVSFPTWIPVQGTLANSSSPSIWGGVSFNIGQSTGVYSIFAVDPGTYTLAAQPSNYIPAILRNVVVGAADLGNPATGGEDFAAFSVGGKLTGTVTINGDTTSQSNPFMIWLNLFDQALGLNAFGQFQMPTNPTTTSVPYQIGGLADGTYQVYPPYLSGFESAGGNSQSVNVVNGQATLNITLNQTTGLITGNVKLPTGRSDYNNVHIQIQGPVGSQYDLASGPAYSMPHLGTGYYNITAYYRTTGAETQLNTFLTNGQTLNADLDLSAQTYSASGNISVKSFTVQTTSGSLTVNTISDLLADAVSQPIYFGGSTYNAAGMLDCAGSTPTYVSTARVEAIPKSFMSSPNSSGSSNQCYTTGQYAYGPINADGSFTIPNLYPGVWEIDVYPDVNNDGTPDATVVKQLITITNTNYTGLSFTFGAGNTVSGTISLPSGVMDVRNFNVQVQTPQGESIQSSVVSLGADGAASSVGYQFSNLPAGSYSVFVQDPGTYDNTLDKNVIKYVAGPVPFTISGTDVSNLNVSLARSATIVGTLSVQGANADGSPSLTLITQNNESLLPSNFQINALADPWVSGGYSQAMWGMNGRINLDANTNQFEIDGLAGGTYDVSFQQQSSGVSVAGAGSLNLATLTKGGVIVNAGSTVDLGNVTLTPGLSVPGIVTDTSGNPLSNIRIEARPSNSNTNNGSGNIDVNTDADGKFNIAGLNPAIKNYDIVVAPRPSPGDTSTQAVPYGQFTKLAFDVTQNPMPPLTVVLTPASAGLTGKIVTSDNGALSYPQGDEAGYPAAAVFVHLEGMPTEDNPLGDENSTALDGSFNIPYLPPGLYDLTIESLGYKPLRLNGVSLTTIVKDLGTLTLSKGAALNTTITTPNGSPVNTSDVSFAVAVTPDVSTVIFGQILADGSKNITGINFAGFDLAPKTYTVLLFDSQNNIITPPEGQGLSFADYSTLTRSLTFRPAAPFAFTHIIRSGANMLITYYLSRPLRNRGDDQDPTQWLSVTSGQGTLSNISVSGDRRQLSATYIPAAGEQNATILFSAHTVDMDPTTGVEFLLTKSVTLLLGQKATVEGSV